MESEPIPECSTSAGAGPSSEENNTEAPALKKKKLCGNLSTFMVKTPQSSKEVIDKQIARAIYATNCSFRSIEHPQVKKAIALLRPGYPPPSRKEVSDRLLDEVYQEEKEKCFSQLANSYVNLSIDGWSNIHNEPIICATITTERGEVFLFDTIDTTGKPHTSAYLTELVIDLIERLKTRYSCRVASVVTDNAANMAKMRKNIKNANTITYGCSAHLLNLLSQDLDMGTVKEHVVQIIKYFRNNHAASALYRKEGGKALVLPQDVRWNTLNDCFEVYISEWQKLLKICEENRNSIDTAIQRKIENIVLKRSVEDFLSLLKPISITLDSLQKNNASLSDAVKAWKGLEAKFEETEISIRQLAMFKKRYEQAMTPSHFLAYLLDPTHTTNHLSEEEEESALEEARTQYEGSGLLPLIIKLKSKSHPFKSVMFSEEILQNVTAIEWWQSQKNVFDEDTQDKIYPILRQLFGAIASSASVERVFSTFGFVHSKIRNRLGTEKAGKLVFLFKYYNCNTI